MNFKYIGKTYGKCKKIIEGLNKITQEILGEFQKFYVNFRKFWDVKFQGRCKKF